MTTTTTPLNKIRPNDPCWCGSGNKFKRCHKAATERVQPAPISPMRPVPDGIERPHYAEHGGTDDRSEPMVKDADTVDRMRRTGAAAAEILRQVGDAIAPGVTTDELDALCHQLCVEAGGYPSPLNYGIDPSFPKSLCTSVNEVICHGIPDARPLRDGDIVNLDVTLFREGVHGDTNATWAVGRADPESMRLIRVTRECTALGIAAVRPGRPVSDIGRAIEDHATAAGFSVVKAFVGHGVGREFHTPPEILHYFHPRADQVMEPGMTFTIEPMIAVGAWQQQLWDDGWTAVTVDAKRVAQFEHTLVVTEDGCELLTLHPDGRWSGDGGQPGAPDGPQ
jgi:methionyl aminopeptidase